ncbi:MAG: phosphoenolpyruvate--protein phosphotransferase [Chitinivibrionales bacterium]|nr:phosphoenolpyruvate--protein phosphotransferase [Chitinivibrionales bacterium]
MIRKKNHIQFLCDFGELNWAFSEGSTVETFLQKTVEMVAAHTSAEVCSVYLFDALDEVLTLKATVGLNRKMIDTVKLRLGEGITGLALKELRALSVKSGEEHPNFRLFKGLDEERFKSFLAVPILRGIKKIGVLVIQRENNEGFTHNELATMQAVSNQLASSIENAQLILEITEHHVPNKVIHHPITQKFIKGQGASLGFAYGPSLVVDRKVSLKKISQVKPDTTLTLEDFQHALSETASQLRLLQDQVEERLSDMASMIFSAHLLLLKDRFFVGKMEILISKGLSPPDAVAGVAQEYIHAFEEKEDLYLREKAHDVLDLSLRILSNLSGKKYGLSSAHKKVVIAETLLPSEMLILAAEGALGAVVVSESATSHMSILSRSLKIPLIICDEPGLLDMPDNTLLLLDAGVGNVYIDPDDPVVDTFMQQHAAREESKKIRGKAKSKTITRDKQQIDLLANINLLADIRNAREMNVAGIGLYRTEFPFMIRSTFPTEEEQLMIYRRVAEKMENRILTFRTLDIGGDKVLSYFNNFKENNPFLGMRSIRFILRNRDIFKQQIRAILRAAKGTGLHIMFPMISSLDEFESARELVTTCLEDLKNEGDVYHESPRIGMMVELPSVVDIIDDFAGIADFFSIGTNDFIQYMLAVDRTNIKVAHLYKPHHPSVLRALAKIARAGKAKNKIVSVCGEMAHSEEYVTFLIGIGITRLSMDPLFIPRIQEHIRKVSLPEAVEYAETLLGYSSLKDIERYIGEYKDGLNEGRK